MNVKNVMAFSAGAAQVGSSVFLGPSAPPVAAGLFASGMNGMLYALRTPQQKITLEGFQKESISGFIHGGTTSTSWLLMQGPTLPLFGRMMVGALSNMIGTFGQAIYDHTKDLNPLELLRQGVIGSLLGSTTSVLKGLVADKIESPVRKVVRHTLSTGVVGAVGSVASRAMTNLISNKPISQGAGEALKEGFITGGVYGLSESSKYHWDHARDGTLPPKNGGIFVNAQPQNSPAYIAAKAKYDTAVQFSKNTLVDMQNLATYIIADAQNRLGGQKGIERFDNKLCQQIENILYESWGIPKGSNIVKHVDATSSKKIHHRDERLKDSITDTLQGHKFNLNRQIIQQAHEEMNRAHHPKSPSPAPPDPKSFSITKLVQESIDYAGSVGAPDNYFIQAQYICSVLAGGDTNSQYYQGLYNYFQEAHDRLNLGIRGPQNNHLSYLVESLQTGNPYKVTRQTPPSSTPVGISFQLNGNGDWSFGPYGFPEMSKQIETLIHPPSAAFDSAKGKEHPKEVYSRDVQPAVNEHPKEGYSHNVQTGVFLAERYVHGIDLNPEMKGLGKHFARKILLGDIVIRTCANLGDAKEKYPNSGFLSKVLCTTFEEIAYFSIEGASVATGTILGTPLGPVGMFAGGTGMGVLAHDTAVDRGDAIESFCHEGIDKIDEVYQKVFGSEEKKES